ncbi:serine/threonine-protein kinase [Pantoea agglomerans]|uniref:serine/threonine protein kinase n=1 Tax=Pantoea TaxID=53335 RepID=UPI002449CDAE|nr:MULTISPECIES: serine/threonine-protein kinase [Pantoea]MDH2121647.1 serine/threonine protein kinase [Pantoea brenneri]MDK4215891.1 serine/threonine protein kinase [Pantoea agglomerans]
MEQRGNYLIKPIGELGSGTFGKVELIELYNTQGHLCGHYARKVLNVRASLVGSLFTYADWIRRFEREVKYQAECSHENIAPICIHHLKTEIPWFVMELAETDLRKALYHQTLNDNQKLNVILMMLKGMAFVHKKGYMHRDLKPENILKFKDGRYKISDFGLVRASDPETQSAILTKIALPMGTEGYMAPEVLRGVYSHKTDIYALGVIINEIGVNHINGIEQVVARATNYTPAGRYDSVTQMIEDVTGILHRRAS